MAELTPANVEDFTGGRLLAADPETGRLLTAALAVARRETGWPVSPVRTETVVMDGPGGTYLYPLTRKIVSLTAATDNGANVLSDVAISTETPWRIARKSGFWSREPAAVTLTMDHGYTEAEAADWRQAILMMVDQMSLLPVSAESGRSDADLVRKRIDDVEYEWSDEGAVALAERVIFSVESIIGGYRLERGFA